jgi:hypothetical protein
MVVAQTVSTDMHPGHEDETCRNILFPPSWKMIMEATMITLPDKWQLLSVLDNSLLLNVSLSISQELYARGMDQGT